MANMDPQIKTLSAIKRELTKHVVAQITPSQRRFVIDFAHRVLEDLEAELTPPAVLSSPLIHPGTVRV